MSSSFAPTACQGIPALYRARRPERTLLHRLVREHLETYLSLARRGEGESDPIPGYVEGAFRQYLECGIPSYGFTRVRCNACGYDFFVAFSCRIRGIYPSCNTRRMVEAAAHLTDHVLPKAPHRQCQRSIDYRHFVVPFPQIDSGPILPFHRWNLLRLPAGETPRTTHSLPQTSTSPGIVLSSQCL